MQCFILAGGFATRLWPITERRAKPLLPLAGKSLLTYAVEAVPKDIPISVSTNAVFAEDLKTWAKTITHRAVTIVVEDTGHEGEKFGALGAVAKWLLEAKIDDDLLLIAGDNYVGCTLEKFLAARRDRPLIAAHDIGNLTLASQFGTVIVDKDPADPSRSVVTSFEEKPQKPKSTCVSTGWWWIPRSALPILIDYAKIHPDNVGGVFEEFLQRKIGVDCFVFTETWRDIGSFDAYLSLHREIVGGRTLAHTSSRIDAATVLKGSIDIGPKTVIEKCTLSDCILFGNATVIDCVLERCIIDEGCRLEGIDLTDKMIREGTTLKNPNSNN